MSNQDISSEENISVPPEEINEHDDTPEDQLLVQGAVQEVVQEVLELPDELLAFVFSEKMKTPSFANVIHTQEISQQFSGPIPPPSVLNDYDKITPGFADRIITMAEKEQDHRHNIESKSLSAGISVQIRGQKFALVICISIIIGCIYLVINDHDAAGGALAGTSLLGLAGLFINGRLAGRSKNDKSEDE